MTDTLSAPPAAPAKRRILDAADLLFSGEGIRAVGVDRLIATAQVTKATFYKHFGSKDRLVVAYLTARHEALAARVAEERARLEDPEQALRTGLAIVLREVGDPANRGSAFLNAAAEHPDPGHPVREIVARHRAWLTAAVLDLAATLGHPAPHDAADDLVLAYEGALMGGYAGDPATAAAVLTRTVERVIAESRIARLAVSA